MDETSRPTTSVADNVWEWKKDEVIDSKQQTTSQ